MEDGPGIQRHARLSTGAILTYSAPELGMGFMFLEVTLIQRLTLFLGYPTHSLSVTLFALLVSTGVGSGLSTRYPRGALLPRIALCSAD